MGVTSKRFTRPLLLTVALFALLLLYLPNFLGAIQENSGLAAALSREDVNGDGTANIFDVVYFMKLARENPQDSKVDYNGDGSYDITDALALLINIFRGILTPLEVVVLPVETDEFLLNPGVGFTSPNATDSNLRSWNPKYPLCSTAYYRWYWNEIEPADDEIDFAMIDSVIDEARKDNQAFCFRVMCQNGAINVPQWLIDKGLKGQYYNPGGEGGFQPDYTDPMFKEHHERLIRALGERYDGHPDIYHVDIGTVGSWGEWNAAGAPSGFELPPDSSLKWVVDLYKESFTKTKLVMLIGGDANLTFAIANGAGWRADCLGDWGMWGPNWNHMQHSYPQALDASEAQEAWMDAPVVFEACGTGTTWFFDGMGVTLPKETARDTTIEWALAQHGTLMNFVYGPSWDDVPDDWIEVYYEWGKRMGYRFVLRRLTHYAAMSAGDSMEISMDWENVGVAPCYYAHPLAFQFRNEETGESWEVITDADITGWLPGEISYRTSIAVPEDIPQGEYELGVALLDLTGEKPRIKFAIEGLAEDGWYRLSKVTFR